MLMTTNYDGDDIEIKEDLPLLPIRDIVIYPFMILPLFVGRKSSIEAVEHAIKHTHRVVLLNSQKGHHSGESWRRRYLRNGYRRHDHAHEATSR